MRASPSALSCPAGVSHVTPDARFAAGQDDGSEVSPHATSLTRVPSSVCHAKPAVVDGSARPSTPAATLPPSPRRTRRMLGVAPTSVLPAAQSVYSARGATSNLQPAG